MVKTRLFRSALAHAVGLGDTINQRGKRLVLSQELLKGDFMEVIIGLFVIGFFLVVIVGLVSVAGSSKRNSELLNQILQIHLRNRIADWQPGEGGMTLEKAQVIMGMQQTLSPQEVATEVYGIADAGLGSFLINYAQGFISSIPASID